MRESDYDDPRKYYDNPRIIWLLIATSWSAALPIWQLGKLHRCPGDSFPFCGLRKIIGGIAVKIMSPKSGSTVLLGAGAVAEIGGPSTWHLTKAIKAREQWDGKTPRSGTIGGIRLLADRLDAYLDPDQANFEDIFHALETLASLRLGLRPKTAKEFKPAIGAYVSLLTIPEINDIILRGALQDIVTVVAEHIERYMSTFDPKGRDEWFAEFWREAVAAGFGDIATLNYDDCVERSLPPGTVIDGFEALTGELFRFDPRQLMTTTKPRLLHLHGSVLYGYPHPDIFNRFAYEDQHEDLYRYSSVALAKATWFGRSTNQAQSADGAIMGPIITGLRKPDKIIGYPYAVYHHAFAEALMESASLLIVGYSFGDLHFNRLIDRMRRLHGNAMRVVVIDYVPADDRGDDWAPEANIRDWPGNEMFTLLARLSKEPRPFDGAYCHPWESKDGQVRVYFEGFKQAVLSHGKDILNFLS